MIYNKRIQIMSFLVISLVLFFTACKKNDKIDTLKTSNSITSTSESTTQPQTTFLEEETTTAPKKKNNRRKPEYVYKKLIDFNAQYPFIVKINRAKNFVSIYGKDKDGRYSIPYRVFRCSVGLNEGSTPLGIFTMSDKYDWRMMVDYTYAQYAIRISGQIMLHSVPYYSPNKNDLEVEEYNKLGSPASLGCIRLNVSNVKWIYDNCSSGTLVIIYDDINEKPAFKLPKKRKAVSSGKKAGWDPTDPDESNPYTKSRGKM